MVQLPGVHPRTERPTERSPRVQNPDAKSRGTRDNAVWLRRVERVPPRLAAPSPPQALNSLHRLAKANRADHPLSYLDTLIKSGSESIEAALRRRRILFAGFVARMEDARLPKCVMFVELVGNGAGKRVDGVFPGPQSFRYQRRPVDDCSPGRGGMAQDGGKFHGEIDSCRGSQGWTTACSGMPERDGKDQKEDSPKQAGSCRFARPC